VIAVVALALSTPALAADPQKAPAPSKEQREKMAEVHQKMAECLRSDRPISECRAEMAKSCQDMVGADGCPMMSYGKGGMGPGMMGPGHGRGGPMMGGPPPAPAPEKPKEK
jgi:hypothetical protein